MIESCLLSIESLPLPFCWQCLLEGQKIAVREHGIEYPSNMWIGMFQFYVCCRCKMALALNIISEQVSLKAQVSLFLSLIPYIKYSSKNLIVLKIILLNAIAFLLGSKHLQVSQYHTCLRYCNINL